MTASELAALIQSLAPAVQHVVTRDVSPVSERVAVLEAKASLVVPPDLEAIAKQAAALIPVPTNGQNGADGKDADVDLDALALKAAELIPAPTNGAKGEPGERGADGKDADPALVTELRDEIRSLRIELMELKALSSLPADVELLRNAVAGTGAAIQEAVEEAISAIPIPTNGRDGKDAEPVDLDAIAVQAAALIPVPKDGQGVTVADVAPLIASEVTRAVQALPVPKDGLGLADAVIDKDGLLVVTFSDGRMKPLGVVVGRDGVGIKGADGKDGLGFDDLRGEYDERGHLWVVFAKGDEAQRYRVPGHVDRGVYKQSESYLQGEGTTYGSSYWIAQRDTTDKPGDGSKDWRLAVKRGGDGKSITGPAGERGPKGEPGPIGPARY